jgi:hypothetical protein
MEADVNPLIAVTFLPSKAGTGLMQLPAKPNLMLQGMLP